MKININADMEKVPTCDIDEKIWETTESESKQSLRSIAETIYQSFLNPIDRISSPFTSKLISSVFRGKAPSLLDLDDSPKKYEDVGKLCIWGNYSRKNNLPGQNMKGF